MNPNSMSGVRATVAAHTTQQQAAHTQQQASHRPGDQVAHYKGATLRTSFAMARPGGMAKGMLAKLKPRPQPTIGGGVARAQADTVESSVDRERGPGRPAGRDGPEHHEPRVERLERDGGGPQQGSSGRDDEPPPRDDAEDPPRRARPRLRAAVRAPGPARRSDTLLRADWAVAAMASGGTAALERALATRLFQVARGPGTVGWRRPWIGNIGALHAAAQGAVFGEEGARGWSGVRATLVALSAGTPPALRLLPNAMRATMFCLLPLVLLDLQRPRTAAQRQDLLVRLAVLSRVSRLARPS